MIDRSKYLYALEKGLKRAPVVALLGPRQCGKTTLARILEAQRRRTTYFDLESMQDIQRLEQAEITLEPLKGLVVIDEIQKKPDLFELIRVLVDRRPLPARFLLLGSASPEIMKHSSESLAGRIEYIELSGFDSGEVNTSKRDHLWVRGGFPRSFLARSMEDSWVWRENFIKTFLERDLPQLGFNIPAITMHRFWRMLAHYHGQTWNASEIGRSLGFSDKTVNKYLELLAGAYMVRVLQPWFENLKKRHVKAPKVYIRDSGIFHCLQDLQDKHALMGSPKLGASWEGFVVEELLGHYKPSNSYYWATHSGAELDLLFLIKGKRHGFEIKWSSAPEYTKSMKTALEYLRLEHIWVIYPGKKSYPLHKDADAVSLSDFREYIK